MSIPRGIFRGQNFMTPEWLGYFKGTLKGKTIYIELSAGTGLRGGADPLFGVTVRDTYGGHVYEAEHKSYGGCFHSRSSAEDYIRDVLHGRPA